MNSTPVSVSLGSRVIPSTIHQQVGYAPYPPTLRAATDLDVEADDYFGPGKFFDAQKMVGRSKAARNRVDAERLWDISEQCSGVIYEFGGRPEPRRSLFGFPY